MLFHPDFFTLFLLLHYVSIAVSSLKKKSLPVLTAHCPVSVGNLVTSLQNLVLLDLPDIHKLPKPKTTTKPSHSHHLSFSIPTFSYFLKNNRYSDPHFFTSNSRFYQTLTSVSRRQHHPCAPVLPSLRVTVLIYVPPTDTCLLHPFSPLYSISTTLPITTCQIGSNCIFLVPSL